MKRLLLILVIILTISKLAFSQGEVDDEQKIFLRNERTYSFLLNSNGWGVNYQYGKMIDAFNKKLYSFDIVGIRHPKEIKLANPYFPNLKRFVFGKKNNFYSLRFGLGKQKKLYSKLDKGGVEIRYFYTLGASVGIIKPIYYEVLYLSASNTYEVKTEKFNTSIHSVFDIYERASFFKGFNEISVMPGIFSKVGGSFEFGNKDEKINAIEVGAILEIFPTDIKIMATKDNSFYFAALFVSYRFGNIFNGRIKKKNKKQKEIDNRGLKDLHR
ncbi:MAG: hypothetical protein DRJ01_03190 [Bacteroidetes bacterium]|nr:MAG: hypothetical protein DRJ01_03190 [Bacteroidota bacterium]